MIIANVDDYRKKSKSRLPTFLYDYIGGGSFQENTLRANIAELQATLLRQRVMVDESHLDLSIHLWDQAMSLPVVLGPVGMAEMYSSRGEVKAPNAAKAVGIPFTLSTMGVCDVHEVAQKTGVPPWFQLYMLKDRGFVKGVIERSVSAGSKALVFTVDLRPPVTIGPQWWRNRMTVYKCVLSVDVEGWKNLVLGFGSAAAVGPLAWRVRDFDGWLIPDGRAG